MKRSLCQLIYSKYSPKPTKKFTKFTTNDAKIKPFSAPSSFFFRECSTTSATSNLLAVFSERVTYPESKVNQELKNKVLVLRDELLEVDEVERIEKVLEEKGVDLFRRYSDGSAVVELLVQLEKKPLLALEVFSWRRRQVDYSALISSEEYTKGIAIAGRLKNVELAVELFKEAQNKELKTTNLYNALMSVYMCNGYYKKCQKLFLNFKMKAECRPSIVTYNILISVLGSKLLIDRMEETFREITDQNLSPNLKTYNNMIAGYITAWMWEPMEKTFQIMQASSVKPKFSTYELMIRGYALSGQLDKMEEIFELVVDRITNRESPLIRCMLFAYSKSSDVNNVNKVEELLLRMPQGGYKPWLNVMLIGLYAREGMLEKMESAINNAIEQNTCVTTAGTMRSIICNYFRNNAAHRLADFVKRAEIAGWKINRSLYHCKMVMYSAQGRLTEMEAVLDEMDKQNLGCSKKTFWIMYKAYKRWVQESRLHQVLGIMCTHGYGIPLSTPTATVHDLPDI